MSKRTFSEHDASLDSPRTKNDISENNNLQFLSKHNQPNKKKVDEAKQVKHLRALLLRAIEKSFTTVPANKVPEHFNDKLQGKFSGNIHELSAKYYVGAKSAMVSEFNQISLEHQLNERFQIYDKLLRDNQFNIVETNNTDETTLLHIKVKQEAIELKKQKIKELEDLVRQQDELILKDEEILKNQLKQAKNYEKYLQHNLSVSHSVHSKTDKLEKDAILRE